MTSLKQEQLATLETPRRSYGVLARGLFWTMDAVYGKQRTFEKFEVLELVARVPYQAWESVAYVGITHTHAVPRTARRIFDFVAESRAQQDNEQWHLLILEELVNHQGTSLGWFRRRALPQLLALFYYHVSWLLYVLNPRLSYRLNADFEDHAEHEYMLFVDENPSFDEAPFESAFEADYGSFDSLGDALRRIGVDEREHKNESLAHMEAPRFGTPTDTVASPTG